MVRSVLRLALLLGPIATASLLAQSSASQLVTVRHASGQSVDIFGDDTGRLLSTASGQNR